jgi:RNA polymerase sigma-70 factor (ECF subfamily)
MRDSDEFIRLTDPYRPELLAHCYRMLGSVHDAEDLVQETILRAWRSFESFEGRSSLRRWLYQIATNRCLTALEKGSRRPLPSGLAGPADQPLAPAESGVAWLQPVPDALIHAMPGDPAAIVAARSSVRLAIVAAMQHLSAKQRAVLILRDVLDWRAAEVAELHDTSPTAVHSMLRRARAQLEAVASSEEDVSEPTQPQSRALLDQYIAAFENADIAALAQLLRDDAMVEMPPSPTWFTGREAVMQFLATQCFTAPGFNRMIPTNANGQPAVAAYQRGADGTYRAHSVQVLTVTTTGIACIVAFLDPSLFATFGLPMSLDPAPVAARAARA